MVLEEKKPKEISKKEVEKEKKDSKEEILENSKEVNVVVEAPKKKRKIKKITDESKFIESLRMSSQDNFSPSLEQVEIAAPTARATDLEQQVAFNSNPIQNDKDDPFKYSAGSDSLEGPTYTSLKEEGSKMFQAQRTDPLEFRREKSFQSNTQEVGRSSFFEQKQSSKSIETYVPVKTRDTTSFSKDDVFAKQDIKYGPSN